MMHQMIGRNQRKRKIGIRTLKNLIFLNPRIRKPALVRQAKKLARKKTSNSKTMNSKTFSMIRDTMTMRRMIIDPPVSKFRETDIEQST